MFRWIISESVNTKASGGNVWNLWKDVSKWNKWDTDLEWSKLEGDFSLDAKGSLKPKGMGIYGFSIIALQEGIRFTTNTPMFLTSMVFDHEIQKTGQEYKITHTVIVSGFMAPLLYYVMRKNLQKGLKDSMRMLAKMAEKGDNHA